MIEINTPRIDVDELKARIREEVAQQRPLDPSVHESAPIYGNEDSFYSPCPSFSSETIVADGDSMPFKKQYVLNDFLGYHGSDFIDNAYAGILRRSPDASGGKHYLDGLQNGGMTKAEILGQLRYSREGRHTKVFVQGLLLPFLLQKFYKLPVLGRGMRIVSGLFNLPTILKNIRGIEYTALTQHRFAMAQAQKSQAHLVQLRDHIAGLQEEIGRLQSSRESEMREEIRQAQSSQKTEMEEALAGLHKEFSQAQSAQKTEIEEGFAGLHKEFSQAQSAQKTETEEALAELHKEINQAQSVQKSVIKEELSESLMGKADKNELVEIVRQIRDHKLNIIDMQRRVQLLLEEARKRLPEPISTEQIENMVKEEDHLMDAMYVSFEDRFRGTREDIKKRQSVYLPQVEQALKASNNGLVLDVGCGRGEWLEFLGENDIQARGLDLNRIMVEQCLEMELDAVQSEVIQYLRSLKRNTLSVISGFHIVEHLPLNTMIALFDEALRVLKPGGMVLFETPNPENLLVGACNFYTDPTHKNPIPPITLEFLIESRGFVNNTVIRLHPMKEVNYINDKAMQDVNDLLYAAGKEQDYALIGYKA